jgi:L-rhamnose-H+ transport protein
VNTSLGFLLTLVSGASVGIVMWPLKWVRAWKWGNNWLFFPICPLILMPSGLAFSVSPHLGRVYSSVSVHDLLLPIQLGALWGLAQQGAGICVSRLSLAITGAVLNGIGGAVGTIVPLFCLHGDQVSQSSGTLILLGIAIMLIGTGCCGWSGYWREQESRERGAGAGFAPEVLRRIRQQDPASTLGVV